MSKRNKLPPTLSIPEVEKLIDTWIFNERNRRILKRRLIDEIKYEQLEEEFELSNRQVKNIVYKGEEIIFSKAQK